MFCEEEKVDPGAPEDNHLPPPENRWGHCSSLSPNGGRWICTRGDGHDGLHRAGKDLWTWTAEWDDERSTDPADMPTELV